MRIHRYGEHAVLLDCEPGDVGGWLLTARSLFPEAVDVVSGARTVLVDGVDVEEASRRLANTGPAPVSAQQATCHELPVRYDGADLEEVARLWNCPPAEVGERHRAVEFTVAFCGFSPGFAYLTGMPDDMAVPRRATPRTKVPAGSVGLAGRFTGVYPSASPGGWQLIGRTHSVLWNPMADRPALLQPGDRVRFVDE